MVWLELGPGPKRNKHARLFIWQHSIKSGKEGENGLGYFPHVHVDSSFSHTRKWKIHLGQTIRFHAPTHPYCFQRSNWLRLFGAVNDFRDEALVWKTFLEDLHRFGAEEGSTVIADSTNLTNEYRRYYVEQTPEFDTHILVLFHIPFDICKKQNLLRTGASVVPNAIMNQLHAQFEKPTQSVMDLYDECIIVEKNFIADSVKAK